MTRPNRREDFSPRGLRAKIDGFGGAAGGRVAARVAAVTIWKVGSFGCVSLREVLRFVQDADAVCLLLCVANRAFPFYFLFGQGPIISCPYGLLTIFVQLYGHGLTSV